MSSGLRRPAYVVCGAITEFIGKGHPNFIDKKHPKFATHKNPNIRYYITESIRRALQHHNGFEVPASLIEQCWVGNFAGELFSNQGHLGAAVADAHLDLLHKPSMRVEGACASGGLAFASAMAAIQGGVDIGLVVGAEVQTTVSPRVGGDYLARASDYERQRGLDDFTFPALFAVRMKAYLKAHGLTLEDVAHTSAKAYANAARNPKAHMHHAPLSLEQCVKSGGFLQNPELTDFLRLSDCSQVSDGGAAMIVASTEGLAKLGLRPAQCVEVLACEHSCGNLYVDGDPLKMETTASAAHKALDRTGLKPADLSMVEVHDCFTIAEALMLEAIGVAKYGRGALMAKEGHTLHTGPIPCNPGGGLVGGGHPVGATGVKQILQASKQMIKTAGGYQLPNPVRYALTANMGGDDKTAVVTILKNGDA
eukprot:NODE_1836_length_1362_cov_34.761943_g1744_i0.p1 GENE.NODE_1836_length_1362_cov_34.761943_g1744_i0~~NODE_1836_length_1362_cov_34.761943_g1744_i0.p1  ORF type:complete len:437 (-),score=143.59 NODE_1836_length_1362_cov_34.761943_g1744_i0:50-1318(-)